MNRWIINFVLIVSLFTLSHHTKATWVGTIATVNIPHITLSAAITGGLSAGLYSLSKHQDELVLINKWSQTKHGRWLLSFADIHTHPKRALVAYHLYTIFFGTLLGTTLGYTISNFFSSERASRLVKFLWHDVKKLKIKNTDTMRSAQDIVNKLPNQSFSDHIFHDTCDNLCRARSKIDKINALSKNVMNNNESNENEKSTCKSISVKASGIIDTIKNSIKTIMSSSEFRKEQEVIARENLAHAQRIHNDFLQERSWNERERNTLIISGTYNKLYYDRFNLSPNMINVSTKNPPPITY